MNRLLLVSICSCTLFAGAPVQADSPKLAPGTVPFRLLKTMHIVVMVKVNGTGPYPVIFDTGAPVTLFNNKVAKASGILGKKAPLFSLFGTNGQANVKSLEIGGITVENTSAIIMDHPTVEAISKVLGPIEGIVGFPFFARFTMTIDYQAQQLTFKPNDFNPPDMMKTLMTTMMTMTQDKPPPAKVLAPAALWGFVIAKTKDDDEPGVDVATVLPESAAARAGLAAGDRLLTMDGRWTDSLLDTYQAAALIKPGSKTPLVIKRQGKEMKILVTPRPGL